MAGATRQERRAFPESETNFSSSFSGLFGTGITVSTCLGDLGPACFAGALPFGASLRGAGADHGLGSLLAELLLPDLDGFEVEAAGFINGW